MQTFTVINGGRIEIERALVRHLFNPHADRREGDILAELLKPRLSRASLTPISPAVPRRSDEGPA